MTTLGTAVKLGDNGKIVAEYTAQTTPAWGEDKNATVGTELASTMHINYVYALSDTASLTIFYNSMTASENSKLREDIATNTANIAVLNAAGQSTAGAEQMGSLLDIYKWSSTPSMGVALNVKFGG